MAAHVQTGTALPAELILETFRYLALPDRISARAVCRAWRALADACPVIVPSDITLEPELLRCYLDQMRAAPLLYAGIVDLDNVHGVNKDEPEELDVAHIIEAHMGRTVVLSLLITCEDDIPEAWRPALEAPAPLLRKLWLKFALENDIGDISLFSHCAPCLTHCSLFAAGDIVSSVCVFKTIQVLVLRGANYQRNLDLVFTSLPALKELSLEPRYLGDMDHADEVDEEGEVIIQFEALDPPASLVRLTIACEAFEIPDIAPMLGWITHDAIPVVSVRHFCSPYSEPGVKPEIAQRMIGVLELPAVASLVVSCSEKECALRLVASDGRERIHAGLCRETLAVLLMNTPPPVTDLVVAGVHVLYTTDSMPSIDPFRTVRSFTLVLRRLSRAHDSAPVSASNIETFLASLSIPPIYCPALESVTLAITQADYDRTGSVQLSAKAVREFLRDKLREDLRGKLKTLCFRGVSVEDVSALQPLAGEILMYACEPLLGFVYPEDEFRRFDRDGLIDELI